jgi:2-oxoglutarate ferredoxin oxidoreductase subunit gamma
VATVDLIVAGFGGQGILFLGEMLARAAVSEGKNATWLPSYGPEQRGGTASCTVVIADETIGSPVVADPEIAIVTSRPSLDKFEPRVRPGGLIIVDASIVDRPVRRPDVRVVEVDAMAHAAALGDSRMANMVLLGALLAAVPVVPVEAVRRALAEHFPPPQEALAAANIRALERGLTAGRSSGRPASSIVV